MAAEPDAPVQPGRAAEAAPDVGGAAGPPPARSLRGRLFGRFADYARRYLTSSVEHRLTLAFEEMAKIHHRLDAVTAQLEGIAASGQRQTEQVTATRTQAEAMRREMGGMLGAFGPRFDELEIKSRPMIAFDDESYAVRLRDGYAMVPRDQPVFSVMVANATSGGLEPGTRRVLQALTAPGMTVADVGANVGLLTLACAMATGPTGRVLAFEPEAGPRAQLEKTRHLNGLTWVEVFDCAVGAKTETRTFNVSPVIGHSSLYPLPADEAGAVRKVKVKVRRLDEVMAEGQALDVVKMDVEGAELDVLAGMTRLLAANADLALVAEFGPSHLQRIGLTPESWFQAFHDQGFRAFEIAEPTGVCRPITFRDVADVVSVNVAFVRPSGEALGRLPR